MVCTTLACPRVPPPFSLAFTSSIESSCDFSHVSASVCCFPQHPGAQHQVTTQG